MQERRTVTITGMPADVASPAVVAGGLIFTSAVSASADSRTSTGPTGPAGPGSIDVQTRASIDRLRTVLEAAGSSLGQVVSVHVYLKHATDFDRMNAAYREAFADRPPVRTTVMADLPAGLLIALSAIAVPAGAPRETLHPAGWMKSPRPYSYLVRAGDWVFLSGLVSRRPSDDQVVSGSVDLQTRTILDNAGVLLKTAGLSYEHVVASRVFVTDDTYFEDMNNQYRRYFTSNPPARATAVAGLMGNDARVEITLIACASPKRVLGPSVSPSLPLSSAVQAGDLLFLSGVLGNTEANAQDLAAQTREVFARTGRTLESVGLSFSHVVDQTVYMTDVWQQKQVDQISRTIFPSEPPARTVVGTRLVTRAGLIEIMMTATGR